MLRRHSQIRRYFGEAVVEITQPTMHAGSDQGINKGKNNSAKSSNE